MKSNDRITFNTHQVPEDGLVLKDSIPPQALDLDSSDLLQPSSPIVYDLVARMVGHDLLVGGRVTTTVAAHCDRCDSEFELNLKVPELYFFQESPLPDFVDVTDFVREELLLQIPSKILCGGSCEAPAGDQEPMPEEASPWHQLDGLELDG